mmetsp:Transcript_1512/g.4146  ORF Transcript_1512/g.4146 Transcript_1512/m.4146 type:complete len:209 (+) Transcript_1512:173-799(+)
MVRPSPSVSRRFHRGPEVLVVNASLQVATDPVVHDAPMLTTRYHQKFNDISNLVRGTSSRILHTQQHPDHPSSQIPLLIVGALRLPRALVKGGTSAKPKFRTRHQFQRDHILDAVRPLHPSHVRPEVHAKIGFLRGRTWRWCSPFLRDAALAEKPPLSQCIYTSHQSGVLRTGHVGRLTTRSAAFEARHVHATPVPQSHEVGSLRNLT